MIIEVQVANDTTSRDFEDLLVKMHAFLMREDVRPHIKDIVINPEFNEVILEYNIRRY